MATRALSLHQDTKLLAPPCIKFDLVPGVANVQSVEQHCNPELGRTIRFNFGKARYQNAGAIHMDQYDFKIHILYFTIILELGVRELFTINSM